jgi:hypothetical protein
MKFNYKTDAHSLSFTDTVLNLVHNPDVLDVYSLKPILVFRGSLTIKSKVI